MEENSFVRFPSQYSVCSRLKISRSVRKVRKIRKVSKIGLKEYRIILRIVSIFAPKMMANNNNVDIRKRGENVEGTLKRTV